MLTDITLEVDLAAVCRRKFSSFSMEFDDSIDSLVPYHMLYLVYMNLHCMNLQIPKGENCNRCLYYRHCHCATQYSMFRKYISIPKAKGKHICEEFKFVHESIMTLRDL